MEKAAVRPSSVLDYAAPTPTRARRWWLLAVFAIGLIAFEDILPPRLTPPGWPLNYDYALMLLLPIGALVMTKLSSLPGWAIGLYGLGGAGTFLLGQFTDTRLHFRFAEPGGIPWFLATWMAFLFGSWFICRSLVLVRRRRAA